MEFRKSVKADIEDIMHIIRQAQAYLKESGIDQWQNNYPNDLTITRDIENGISYVLVGDEGIVATAAISFDGEKTYNTIYEGQWISDVPYVVIHRIAVMNSYKGQGVSSEIIQQVEALCLERDVRSIRVDTHKDNLSMQKLLKKNDFVYCGIIYLEDGNQRVAYEKVRRSTI